MTDIAPMEFMWDAGAEVMVPRRKAMASRVYVDQEWYRLAPHEERSTNSHNFFFAALHEAYQNLPEAVSDRFVNSDHFRKDCLIEAGFYDERSFVCTSKAEAARLAAFLKPINEYARIVVHGVVVIERTAKSQSYKAMGREEFGRSKTAVLEIAAALIGATVETLKQNVGKAA